MVLEIETVVFGGVVGEVVGAVLGVTLGVCRMILNV